MTATHGDSDSNPQKNDKGVNGIRSLDDVWPVGKKKAYFTLGVIFLFGVLDLADRQVLAALFPYLKEAYALSDTQLGMLVSILNISIAVLVIPSGYLIDRWSRKKMLCTMGLVWSMATASCALAGSYAHLLAARFFVGFGESGYSPVAQSLLTVSFPKRLRSTVIALQQTSGALGVPLGLVLGAFIAEQWGWRHALGIVAIPGVLISLLSLRIQDFKNRPRTNSGPAASYPAPAAPENDSAGVHPRAQAETQTNTATDTLADTLTDAPQNASQTSPNMESRQPAAPLPTSQSMTYLAEVGELLRMPSMLCIYIACAFSLMFGSAVMSWLPSYFNRVGNMPVTSASALAGLVMVFGTVGMLLSGPFLDWLRRKGPMAAIIWQAFAGFATFGLCVLVYAVATPGGPFQIVCLLGQSLMSCSITPMAFTLVADLTHPSNRATAVSLVITLQNVFGMAAGPLLMGFLSDYFSLGSALLLMSTCYIVAGAAFTVILFTYKKDVTRVDGGSAEF